MRWREIQDPGPWAVMVGKARDGRIEAVETVISALGALGCTVGGGLQVLVEGGYALRNLNTGAEASIAYISKRPDMCDWAFDPRGFEAGLRWAQGATEDVVFQPAGRLEAVCKGHFEAARAALTRGRGVTVLCIPANALPAIALELPDPAAWLALPASPDALDAFAAALAAAAKRAPT